MKNLIRHIPNALTLFNLFFGSIAVYLAFTGSFQIAAWLIIVAAIFDFLDGTAARLLNARSDIGKELDSLADVISFGLAPATIMYSLLASATDWDTSGIKGIQLAALPALLIVICSALRLAKFNIDPSQSDSFRGLPTPANALFIISLPFIQLRAMNEPSSLAAFSGNLVGNYYVLLILTMVLSLLLVSNIPLMGFKVKSFGWSQNKYRFVFLSLSMMLVLMTGFISAPFILILYFALSAVDHYFKPA